MLITGAYGSGKSTLAAEIADLLAERRVAYGAVDVDWLTWFDVPGLEPDASRRVYLDNVANVTRSDRDAGVRHVVLAVAPRDRADLDAVREAAGMPLQIVRLAVPLGWTR